MRIVSLFAGAGGLDLGFKNAVPVKFAYHLAQQIRAQLQPVLNVEQASIHVLDKVI